MNKRASRARSSRSQQTSNDNLILRLATEICLASVVARPGSRPQAGGWGWGRGGKEGGGGDGRAQGRRGGQGCEQAASYPKACHGDLHGIGNGQARQQAALLGDILHDHLLPKLGPLAAVADGNAGPHLTSIHCALCNQQPPCSERASSAFTDPRKRQGVDEAVLVRRDKDGNMQQNTKTSSPPPFPPHQD